MIWFLFFWRLFTPIEGDQASLRQGDFSGQFVTFGAYQYERFANGEVPLWNPYNNGGLPFIADTQAAVFYPPRLITIGLAKLSGGWSYHALELEMVFHVLAYTLFMYIFVRRLTKAQDGSVVGAFVAAVITGYGGFTTGYPPLQLALLEAAIWLPLGALGILEATRKERPQWLWLVLSGWALGMSWMAGHPQTSWFLTYLLVAYWGYRVYQQRYHWRIFVLGTALFGGLSFGVTAIQFIPGIEYLMRTARAGLEFEAKSNGFPLQDIVQIIWPSVVSYFSPLYIGLGGLALALIALWRRLPQSLFWGIVALIALAHSLGGNGLLYHTLYNILPGLRFFRGQERAAYLFANSMAILAGIGAAHLITWDVLQDFKATRQIRRGLLGLTLVTGIIAGGVLLLWLGNSEAYGIYLEPVIFSFFIAAGLLFVLPWFLQAPQQNLRVIVFAGFIAFELLWFSIDNNNFEPIPPQQQLSMTPPPMVQAVLDDTDGIFRVDGWRGLTDNYGSMYHVMDMRGISPLFLDGPHAIIYFNFVNNRPAWEVFAVRYVYSGQDTLGVPTEIVMQGQDRDGVVYLHKLLNPRPFAHLVYQAEVLDSSEFARELLLLEPRFNAREEVILTQTPTLDLPETPPENAGQAIITHFAPETFTIEVATPENAILSIAHPYYPGWQATLDGEPVEILEAYGALSAVEVPQGEHTIVFVYAPNSYKLGAVISLITWSMLGVLAIIVIGRKVNHAIKQ
ncbi:MAG: hypothetical protein D6712_01810 [Chloroflexi bacterium]|nr:MAG: hypothetical protein D6712_01810 [Chloroflexota bacterium]